MKKLLQLLVILVATVLLAGCDLLPQEVVDITEEYCRENPNEEACQGDIVNDLEETTIINFFETIVNDYLNGVDVCTAYFSITNTNLLDDCRAATDFIVPAGFTEFNVDSVTEQPSLGGSTKYIILASTDVTGVVIEFTISFVAVDGEYFVDEWTYTQDYDPTQTTDLTLLEAEAIFQQFITDYLDTSITSQALCDMYGLNQEGEDSCASDRDESLASGFSVMLLDLSENADGSYQYIIQFNENGETSEETSDVIIQKLADGSIIIKFIDDSCNVRLTPTEAYPVLEQFVNDYVNPSITDEYINETYFDWNANMDWLSERQQSLTDGIQVTLISVEYFDSSSDILKVTLEISMNGETDTVINEMTVDDFCDGTYFIWINFQDGPNDPYMLNPDEARPVLEQFIADYFNPNVTDDYLNEMYFDFMAPNDFFAQRAEDINSGVTISLGTIEYDSTNPDSPLKVEFIFTENGNTESNMVPVRIFDLGNGKYMIAFEDNNNGEWDMQLLQNFMEQLVYDYNDMSLSDDVVCNTYFAPDDAPGCIENRTQVRNDNIQIHLMGIWWDNGNYMVEFKHIFNDGTEHIQTVAAFFFYNEFNELKVHFEEPYYGPNFDELYPFVESYMNVYMDYALGSEVACNLRDSYQYQECFDLREQDIQDGWYVVNWYFYEDNGRFVLEKHYQNGTNETFVDYYEVYGHYDQNNNLVLELHMKDENHVDFDTAKAFLHQFVMDLTDQSITDDAFCQMYLTPDQYNDCINIRQQYAGLTVTLETFDVAGWDYFLRLGVSDGTNVWIDEYYVYVYYVDQNAINIWFNFGQQPSDDIYQYMDSMITDLLDPNIPIDQVCSTYFMESMCPLYPDMIPTVPVYYNFDLWVEHDGRHTVALHFYDSNNNNMIYDFSFSFWVEYRDGMIYIHVDDNQNWIPWDVIFPILDPMIQDLNDPNVSSTDFCMNWGYLFNDEALCNTIKGNVINGQVYMFGITEQFGPNNFQVEYSLMDGNNNIIELLLFEYNVNYDDMNNLIIQPVNASCMLTVYSEADTVSVFTQFALDYENPSISDQQLLDTYFQLNQHSDMFKERQDELAQGVIIDSLVFGTIDNLGYVPVTITMTVNGETHSFDEMVRVMSCNGLMQIMFAPRFDDGPMIDPMVLNNLLDQFVIDYNNTAITDNELCTQYMVNNANLIANCEGTRNGIHQNNDYIQLTQVIYGDHGMYAEFAVYDNQGIFLDMFSYMIFIYHENNQVFIQFDISDLPNTINITNNMEATIETFLNQNVSSYVFCVGVVDRNQTDCEAERNEVLNAYVIIDELLFIDFNQHQDHNEWLYSYRLVDNAMTVEYIIDFIIYEYPDHYDFTFYIIESHPLS